MMRRCPRCASYGIYKNRRAPWQRLLRLPHTYGCIDCGTLFSRRALRAETAAREAGHPARHDMTSTRKRLILALGLKRLAVHARDTGRLAGQARGRLRRLLQMAGLAPIPVWVVKQVDADLLHLCGPGTLEHQQRPWAALTALRQHRYRGGVRLGNSGIVLNSRLFAELIPHEALTLQGPSLARWEGRVWRIAQVPRRSWEHDGPLVASAAPHGQGELLVSVEDVSPIRDHVDPQAVAQGTAVFEPGSSRRGGPVPARGPIRPRGL